MESTRVFIEFLMVLGLALVCGATAQRLRQPVVIGYLAAGLLLGRANPFVSVGGEAIQSFADLGVTFLMFSLGVHFSFRELLELRRIALWGGGGQILITALLAGTSFTTIGFAFGQAVLLAEIVAISSSIVALTLLQMRGAFNEPYARLIVGIALAQDLLVIPFLAIVPALTGESAGAIGLEVTRSLLLAGAVLVSLALLGTRVVPWVLYQVARLGSRELFLLSIVAIAFGVALAGQEAGLSFALGAFLAGVVVSESEFAHQVLGEIVPLRDVFSVMFFAGLGLLLDPEAIARNWPAVVAILLAVVVVKGFTTALVLTRLGYPPEASVHAGLYLCQIGELSFVLALQGLAFAVIDADLYNAIIAAAVISIVVNSGLVSAANRVVPVLALPLRTAAAAEPELMPNPAPDSSPLRGHVVVAGYGRTGRELVRALERRGFRYIVIDRDPDTIRLLRRRGIPAVYGDAANERVLQAARIPQARVFAIAIPDPLAAETAVRVARRLNPVLDIIARADRRVHVHRLAEAGATEVVHPSFEAGLEMVRHTLHRYGVGIQEIQALISARRLDYYEEPEQPEE
uniref:RCK N-terminal domain-containing protein n=1 Tax=Thermorudis peleae TaxID=1382356 RepID=A0A831X875_9BACT